MSSPGVEPGLSRPRHDVLTTRRWGLITSLVRADNLDRRFPHRRPMHHVLNMNGMTEPASLYE